MTGLLRNTCSLALVALLGLAAAGESQAQTGTITGRVVDARTMQPLSSAQVSIPQLSVGVLTQQNGRFILLNVPTGTHTVSVQRIGYRTMTESVAAVAGESVSRDFSLVEEVLALNEIIVTGTPGGTQRRAIGNVVTRVNAESLTERVPVANMQQMLTGRAPGLSFVRNSGNIGTGSPIRIRGVSSLSLGSQPLIYVDGVRVNNSGSLGPNVLSGASTSALDDFNPDDIASIEVIKGPAAATLYGTEASAGVIQIITKKGQSGAPQFEIALNQGSNFLINPRKMIGDQWGCRVTTRPCPENQLFTFNILDHEREVNGREVFQSGPSMGANISLRGGSNAIRYFLSTDYNDQQGIVDYNYDQKLSLRANVGVLISEQVDLNVSTGFVRGDTRYMMGDLNGGLWDNVMWAQGHLLDGPKRGFLQNTPEDFATVAATRESTRFTGSATLTHTPREWLTQRFIVGTDYGADENQILYPRHPDGAAGPFRNQSLGDVRVSRPINNLVTADYSASARYALNPAVGLTSSFGIQYYSREENTINSSGTVFASPAIRSVEGATSRSTGQTFIQNKSLGLFVQQEANLNDRVYLTGAVRADDNSAFGSEFDAAIYPKLSAAWVVSDEGFWPFGDNIGSFRLRSAWGKAGRQPNTFAAVTLFSPTVGPGGSAAVTPGQFGNAEIGPEISTELELGFEAAFLNDRISTDFTYFTQQIRDALITLPLAPSEGFSGNQDANVGQMDNWGWELRVDARAIVARNFSVDLGFSGAHSRNNIVDLGGRPATNDVREGFPFPVYTSNIIRSAEFDALRRPINVMCDGGTGPENRLRGGESVPCAQMAGRSLLLGTQYPTHTWAFDGTVTVLRDLQLFGLVQGEFGRWGSETNVYCRHTPCYSNTRTALLRDDPVYEEGVFFNGRHPTDGTLYIRYDADFWKLREVGARYNLPTNLVRKTGADRAALSLSGRNLWTIWQRTKDISGVPIPDVELANPTGTSALFQVPGLASVVASLRVTF